MVSNDNIKVNMKLFSVQGCRTFQTSEETVRPSVQLVGITAQVSHWSIKKYISGNNNFLLKMLKAFNCMYSSLGNIIAAIEVKL